MNWNQLNKHGENPSDAFEQLCNQLFYNWVNGEFAEEKEEFIANNGSGGDGGVEAYVKLKNSNYIGVQAKWFPKSMDSSHFSQIRQSLKTALKVRPNIEKYIVCVPRNLTNDTLKPNSSSERHKWNVLVSDFKKEYPKLTVELWDDFRLTEEIQKEESCGLRKFWFDTLEIGLQALRDNYEQAEKNWLTERYLPDLAENGEIYKELIKRNQELAKKGDLKRDYICLIKEFDSVKSEISKIDELDGAISCIVSVNEYKDFKRELNEIIKELDRRCRFLERDEVEDENEDNELFFTDSNYVFTCFSNIKFSKAADRYFKCVKKKLEKIDFLNLNKLFEKYHKFFTKNPLLVLGAPGTGKTNAVAKYTCTTLKDKTDLPLLVCARELHDLSSWKRILCDVLKISDSWSEDEIFSYLSLSALRYRKLTKRKLILTIIIDGLDESRDSNVWNLRIAEAIKYAKRNKYVKFVFTARYSFNCSIKRKDGLDYFYVHPKGDIDPSRLTDRYFKYYGIDIGDNIWLKYAFREPLSLKLFCQKYQGWRFGNINSSNITLDGLLKTRIDDVEKEFCIRHSEYCLEDQIIRKAIYIISEEYVKTKNKVKWDDIKKIMRNEMDLNYKESSKILTILKDYGIIYTQDEKDHVAFSADVVYIYPTSQVYFDYILAVNLLARIGHPSKINFEEYGEVIDEAIEMISLISIRDYHYLITENKSFLNAYVNSNYTDGIFLLSILNCRFQDRKRHINTLLAYINKSPNKLRRVVNEVVLPLSRDFSNPLGIKFIDNLLKSYSCPVDRDMIWSIPEYLDDIQHRIFYKDNFFDSEYSLDASDNYRGLPILYAWKLSSLNWAVVTRARDELLEWGMINKVEFFKLFKCFCRINDPQLFNQLYSILLSLLINSKDVQLLKVSLEWIRINILNKYKLETYISASNIYYSYAIFKIAEDLGIVRSNEVIKLKCNVTRLSKLIKFSKFAINESNVMGWHGMSYDLSRYVIFVHFDQFFREFQSSKKYLLLRRYCCKGYRYSFEKLILSCCYRYILEKGWSFRKCKFLSPTHCGIDLAISKKYYPASHGSRSKIMTIQEKYTWLARDYYTGIFSLLLGRISELYRIENFKIPELNCRIYNNTIDLPVKDVSEKVPLSEIDVENAIKHSKKIDPIEWIFNNNGELIRDVVCISRNSSYEGNHTTSTYVSINAFAFNKSEKNDVIKELHNFMTECRQKDDNSLCTFHRVVEDYVRGDERCYITPEEICSNFDEEKIEENKFFGKILYPLTRECTTYSDCDHERSYFIPSKFLRSLLEIRRTDRVSYFNGNNESLVLNLRTWEDYFSYDLGLFCRRNILDIISSKGFELVWFIREIKDRNIKNQDRFKPFYCGMKRLYILYFDNSQHPRVIDCEVYEGN